MGYYTYFQGELSIHLKEPHLSKLKKYLSLGFRNKEVIVVDENSLRVNAEWKNTGLMEDVVLFIGKYGELISGKICCNGEDIKDVWEISIEENKPVIREKGKVVTYSRTFSQEKF